MLSKLFVVFSVMFLSSQVFAGASCKLTPLHPVDLDIPKQTIVLNEAAKIPIMTPAVGRALTQFSKESMQLPLSGDVTVVFTTEGTGYGIVKFIDLYVAGERVQKADVSTDEDTQTHAVLKTEMQDYEVDCRL
jgi:hypothetical protein